MVRAQCARDRERERVEHVKENAMTSSRLLLLVLATLLAPSCQRGESVLMKSEHSRFPTLISPASAISLLKPERNHFQNSFIVSFPLTETTQWLQIEALKSIVNFKD